MEEVQKLTISGPILEKLRCFSCKAYLSCSPIQLLANGRSICGRCPVSGDDGPPFRELSFEAVLSSALFPCQFENNGCPKLLPFGLVNDHEVKCIYQHQFCPISLAPNNECKWSGPWPQVTNHIIEKHPEFIRKQPGFEFEVTCFNEGIFMAEYMGISFMLTHHYFFPKKELHYRIQYLPSMRDFQDEVCKIRLTNVSEPVFTCTIGGKCAPFDVTFHHYDHVLPIRKYLEFLNNPEIISFNVELVLDLTLDCKLLESLKCNGCHGYLIPPIFDSDQGVICYDCFDDYHNCRSSSNEEMKELIANTNYPCRWNGCDFVDKSVNIRKHELECRFCIYQCPGSKASTSTVFIENCDESFKCNEAISHFDKHLHKFQYFCGDEFTYKISLWKSNADVKLSIFTLKYGRVVLIQGSSGRDQHSIAVRVSEGYTSPNGQKMHLHPIKCSLQFGHDHCDIKSKMFIVGQTRTFKINDFPDCFKSDECLNVTLKLFQEIISI